MSGYDNLLSFIISTLLVSGVVMETQPCVDLSTGVVQGRRYTGQTYTATTQYGFQQCIDLCWRRNECQSINYDKSRLLCELNLDFTLYVTMLTLHSDYLYVDMIAAVSFIEQDVACVLNPCQAHSVCIELHDGNTTCIDEPGPVLTTNPTKTGTNGPTTLTNFAGVASCSSPYTYHAEADFCVMAVLGSYKQDWYAARSACMSNDGDLAKADTGPKSSVVASLVGPLTGGWVGASYNPSSGSMVWLPSIAIVEPPLQEHDRQCVTIYNDGHLELSDCTVKREFVCEKNA